MLISKHTISNFFATCFLSAMLASSAVALLSCFLYASNDFSSANSLSMSVDAPEADVLQALQLVVDDQIIHGTQQYAKEKILYGAHAAQSSSVFGNHAESAKTFYKVADGVLAPANFVDSSARGTITVRYEVLPVSNNRTNIRIDAVYIEDDRRRVHRSEGVVESAEYAEFNKRLQELRANRIQEREDSNKLAQLQAEAQALAHPPNASDMQLPAASSTVQQLEARVHDLRRQVERVVSTPGTELKSAPFRSASTILSLPAQTNVLVMVITPYWLGVETTDGHRGWIHRSHLEALP